MKFKSNLLPGPFDILAVLFLLGLMILGYSSFGDPGIYWHLKTGRIILGNGAIPNADPFLTPTPTNIWICDQWLSDIIFYTTYYFGGWRGLSVITIFFLVGTYIQTASLIAKRYSNSLLVVFIVVVLAALTAIMQWFTRPVVISFFFVAMIYHYAIEWANSELTKKEFLGFCGCSALLFMLWANLHPAFIIGLFVLGAFSLQKVVNSSNKQKAILTCGLLLTICSLATLVNPFGIDLYHQVFGLVSSDYFMKLNDEWKSPNFQDSTYWFFLTSLFIIFIATLFQKTRTLQIGEFICFIALLIMSLNHSRYIPFFAIIMTPFLTKSLLGLIEATKNYRYLAIISRISEIPCWNGTRTLCFTSLSLLLLIFTHQLPDRFQIPLSIIKKFPLKALDTITTEYKGEAVKIFHTPNWGGVITFFYWPPLSAFIDDRNSLIGKDRYEDYLTISNMRPNWRETIDKYDFQLLLLEPKVLLAKHLQETQEWPIVYQDPQAIVFRRK